jgi:hypothetical protein
LRKEGIVSLYTGGGERWSKEVATRLGNAIGQPVVFLGKHPEDSEVYQFSMNLGNNKDAKVLLAKDDIR